MDLARIRKLLVAVAGLAVIVAPDVFGVEFPEHVGNALDAIVAVLTAAGVFAVRNRQSVNDLRDAADHEPTPHVVLEDFSQHQH